MRARAFLTTTVAAAVLLGGLSACGGDDDDVSTKAKATTTSSSSTSTSSTTTTVADTTTTTAGGSGGVKDAPKEKKCVEASSGQVVPVADGWETRWQTKPEANDPVTMKVCVDDVTPGVGQAVHLTLTADDPDAKIVQAECGWFITWQDDHGSLCRDYIMAGVHPVPPEEPGHIDVADAHTYTQQGSFTITVSVWSAEYAGYTSPYSNYVEATIPVQVHPTLVVD